MKTNDTRPSGFRKAFTLVELLVVIAIIGVLIALLLPAVQAAREAARRMSCSSNMKNFALAMHNYHDTHGRLTPPGFWTNGASMQVLILPFIEQNGIYSQYDFGKGNSLLGSLRSRKYDLSQNRVGTFLCPSAPSPFSQNNTEVTTHYTTHYYGIMGPIGLVSGFNYRYSLFFEGIGVNCFDGMFPPPHGCGLEDVTDGTSNTFMLGEMARTGLSPTGSPKIGHRARGWTRGMEIDAFDGTSYSENDSYHNQVYPNQNLHCYVWGAKNIKRDETINRPVEHDEFNNPGFGSMHPGGCQFALGDASVRFFSETIAEAVYKGMASRNGGENISPP